MEQKSNVQLNSKCKIIDISQKYSCRGNPNFLLEKLHRIDAVKLRKDIVPQVAAAYYSGGIIQILRYWVTSSSQGRQAAQYDI